jgi:hypothetical protein
MRISARAAASLKAKPRRGASAGGPVSDRTNAPASLKRDWISRGIAPILLCIRGARASASLKLRHDLDAPAFDAEARAPRPH